MEKSHNTNRDPIWVDLDCDPWIISDTHFYHRNIIKYTGRPFKTCEEMNETIIDNWNSLVGKDELIVHFGDFGLSRVENLEKIINRLNGRKWIIIGNHDRSRNWYMGHGFERAFNRSIEIEDYILSHRPIVPCKKKNIHGHMHEKKMRNPIYLNVSVEHTDYKPIRLSDAMKKFDKNGK